MFSLVEQQITIEEQMVLDNESRQQKDIKQGKQRGELGATRHGRVLVKAFTKAYHDRVAVFVGSARQKKHGKHAIAAKLLLDTGIPTTLITYLAFKALMNCVLQAKNGVKRVTLCRRIGDLIHDEWRVRFFADDKNRKAILGKLCKDFDKRAYPREWRKRTIKNYFDAHMLDWDGWNNRQKIHVGYALLTLFNQSNELLKDDRNGSVYYPSDELMDLAQGILKKQLPQFVLYRPMVVPPYDWKRDNLYRGGYISGKIQRYPIVKTFGKKDLPRLDNFDWDSILPSINALQRTPWRVNKQMLEALNWAYYDAGGDIGKLVRRKEIPLPPLPEDYHTDPKVKKEHNHKVFLIHDQNRQDISKRIAALMTMSRGEQFSKYDAIYFPHNMDFRGRAYPLPAFLNPQGPDYAKALLEFSNGHPIGNEEGANWLAIAGANAYGNDKVSLQERVGWVRENEEMILSIAKDYRSDRRWMHVSEPFQFLRFCLEWLAYREQGYGLLSHIVIPVDATCSGLQHYGAMLRDEVGGRSVNLVPGLDRQDIYGDVASCVIRKLVGDGTPLAKDWLAFGIDRKITKRQVMVVPYAGKFSSCLAYTKEAVAEKLASGVQASWNIYDDKDHHERQLYLARLIWQAIDEVVVKGKQAMQWLSQLASQWAKYANTLTTTQVFDKRMSWLTPDGFEVVHFVEDMKEYELATNLDGRVRLKLQEGNGRLKVSGMSLAVAPNFVHALDATHLRLTIRRAQTLGITDFGMVHDSFGVHASHMVRFLEEAVKPSFVQMYTEHDPLQELADRYASVIDTGEIPSKGTLVIEDVQKSEFFFS